MKKNRRILALLIAMVMMVTDVSGIWAADEKIQDYTSEAETGTSGEEKGEQQGASMNAAAEGEGTVGSLVSDELSQEFTRTQADAHISELTVEGKSVTVSYVTNMQADLVVGIFTEDGKSLLSSGHTLVEPTEQTSVQIELSDTPPQYFTASAYLLGPETREPLCEAYNSQYYTKDIQDLMNKTAEDFEDTGRLVYLETGTGNDQNLNFAVYKESTVVFNENGSTDILTKNTDGTWTFTNASTKAKSLKEGDIVAYNYKTGLMDACRVVKVVVKGNTVIVTTGDEIRLEDIFEQLRIHSEGGVKVKDVDTSDMSEYLTYKGLTDGDTEEVAVQSDEDMDAAGAFSDIMSTPTAKMDISGKNTTWSAKGNLKLVIENVRMEVALSWQHSYIQFNMDWNLIVNFTFEGTTDGEWEWTMMELTFTPIAGCDVSVMPAFCLEVTGSVINVTSSIRGSAGVMFDGARHDASEGPKVENDLKIEASLFLGMKFKIAVKVLDKIENLKSELSISVKAGAEFKVSTTIPVMPDKREKKHSCKQCLSIAINLKLSVTLQLDVINDAIKTAVTLTSLTWNQGTYFYSIDYSGLGEGSCPHYLYKTSFAVTDKTTGKPVENAKISIKFLKGKTECDGKETKNEEWPDSSLMKTDENGGFSILLAPGEYEAVFDKDSLTARGKFTVEAKSEEYEITMDERVYSITYNIKDQKGIAQRGAEVTATDSKGKVTKATADGSGKANLQLVGGAYDIEIHSGDLEKKFSTKVSMNLEMDVKLHGPAYKVDVSVVDENGNPVADACIAGLDSEKVNVLDDSAVTDENGKAEVYLEDGDYTLQVTKTEGDLEGESSVTVNGEDQEVTITVYGKRTITVQVQDESGNPLENAGVVAVSGDKRYDGITDRNGNAELVLGRGTWELTGKKDELSGTGTVTVEDVDKSVTLTLKEAVYEVTINFNVTGDETYNGYTAKLYSEDGKLVKSYGDTGEWNLELKKGRYLLVLVQAWYWGGMGAITSRTPVGITKWIQVDEDTTTTVYGSKSTVSVSQSGDTLYVNGTGVLGTLQKEDCTAEVKKVVIGSGVEYISSNVFKNTDCSGVEEITLPSSVKVIDDAAFAECTSLKNMTVPSTVRYLGLGAIAGLHMENLNLYGAYTLRVGGYSYTDSSMFTGMTENLTVGVKNVVGYSLGKYAKNIVFTDEVENVNAAFEESNVETVIMSDSIQTELSEKAFYNCDKLQKVKLPSGITRIPEYAFQNCTSLTEIELPEKVSEIGASAFRGCNALQKISIPDNVTEVKSGTFYDCTALEDVILSENISTINREAFYNCSSLKSIKIPQSVKTIGYSSFQNCTALETIDMTEATVEKIDTFAFRDTGLKKFTIPETVATMAGSSLSGVVLDELTVLGYDGFNLQSLGATAKKIIVNVPKVVKVGNSECETIIIGEKVKRIENDAFKGASHVKEIVWPEHLEYLGYIDFSEFTELEELNMPDKIDSGGQLISKMPASLKRVKLPEGYSEIYIDAFTKCTNLKEVQLPASIEKIWFDAFANCKNLESVTFNEGSHLKSIGSSAFHGCTSLKKIVLGNEVETIYEDAFMGCTSLTEAVVPSGKIYCNGKLLDNFSTSWAFDECPNLTSLTLGSENVVMSANSTMTGLKKITLLDTVKEISKGTCPNVEEIVIPASVKTIEQGAFKDWKGLRKVTILGDKIQLPKSLFSGCTALEEVNIQGEITDLEDNVFSGCKNLKKIDQSKLLKHMYVVPAGLFDGCSSLTKAEIPDHITKIGASAYRDCTGLTELELPDHITDIKEGAFEGCTSLTEIDIPKSVESIGVGAFYGCRNLKSVFIPASVTSIRENAFDNRWIENICFEDMHTYYGGDILSIVYSSQGGDIDLRQEKMRDEIYYDRLDQVHVQMKSINIFYPTGQTVTEQYKEHLGLQYCTWIPYTGSLDDPETFMASDELQAAVGAEGFSDGLSETETGTTEPEVTEEQTQPEEVIISDDEESAGDGNSSETDDSGEVSVEEGFDDGEELIVNEIEKPVFEAAEGFTAGSAVLELNAAGEAVSGVIQTKTYTGLVENSNCFFAVVRDQDAEDFFAPSNLLFMTQAVSDEDGNLTIEYRTADNTGIPVLYGAEKSLDISDAEITVEEGLVYTGQEQKPAVTVVYSGETLTENKDYVLKGDTAVTDAGTYSIKVVGRNPYKGSAEKEYQVAKAKQKISTGMMIRELTVGSKVSLRANGIGTMSYVSRQPDVVSVDARGMLTAKKAGVASVVIQASGDKNHTSARKNVIVFVKAGTGNGGNNGNNGNTGNNGNSGNQNTGGNNAQKPAVKKSVMKLNASSLVLRKKQKTSAFAVSGMVSGDYVKSVTSGNKKLVKVVSFTKAGKITLQAQKKTGKTTLTILLANGAKKTIKVKVQAGKVKTSKISISKKVRIKKGKKLTLKPVLTPITSQEKVTFTSSNKKVATVTSKGVIKTKKPGKTKITVRSGKKKVIVTVTVTK